ncbi:extracellular solute-binding protein [Phaeovulum sp.]|uniref:extracellular solute-binding protein n=1 Tax=Phaeovulum sp. TaxID=2934796 RepID=UPI0039E658B7
MAMTKGFAGIRAAILALTVGLILPVGGRAEEALIHSHGISTFGDLHYGPDFTHLDYVNPDALKGGEISVWTMGGFDSYNPYTLKGRAAALSSGVHETLLAGTADEIGAAYGLLAESLEYPESRDWVVFTLREGAKFSDGSAVTADDVLFSYEILRDKGLSSFRGVIVQMIASAEVIDARHIKFIFTPNYPRRDVIQAAGGLPIFSKAEYIATGRDLEDSSDTPFLGSGPYVFDSADSGRRVVWRRNPDYWGADLPINRGRNNFDKIRVEYFGDYQAAFEGFKAGAYTFRDEASSLIWATSYDFPALTKGWVIKDELPNGAIASGQAFAINLRRDRFQDIRVREALGLMFNFEWSNETLFYGLYTRTNSFWDNSELAATGTPGADELALLEPLAGQLPKGVLTDEVVIAPVSGQRQLDRNNLRKAAALLDEAGWPVGNDGIRRNERGETLRVEILNDSQTFDRVVNPYVENLRQLGLDAVHSRVDDAQYTNRQRSHDFDIITAQLGQEYIPGSGLQQYFGSGSVNDTFNAMGLADPAVDALISKVEGAKTRAEMTVAVHALDRVLRALKFWVPQWYKPSFTIAYYDMYEHPEKLPPYALGQLDFWWYNAEKAEKLKAAGAF